MNEKELAEIEARAEAATPGPWFWDTNRRYKSTMLKAPQNGGTCVMDFTRWGMHSAQPRFNDTGVSFGGILYTMEQYDKTGLPNPNADFIAYARQDVPTLVAEVRRLSGENERLLATIQDTCTWSEDDDTDDVIWDTECGETVVFEDGTPKENGYRHCHYCGKNIIFSLKGGAQ